MEDLNFFIVTPHDISRLCLRVQYLFSLLNFSPAVSNSTSKLDFSGES